jgi:hypothetical protein
MTVKRALPDRTPERPSPPRGVVKRALAERKIERPKTRGTVRRVTR